MNRETESSIDFTFTIEWAATQRMMDNPPSDVFYRPQQKISGFHRWVINGGRGNQPVLDGWGGSKNLSGAMIAEHGCVGMWDNRGHRRRGRIPGNDVYAAGSLWNNGPDAIEALSIWDSPYVDKDRIGIFGWSYGGYGPLRYVFLRANDVFKAALVVAL